MDFELFNAILGVIFEFQCVLPYKLLMILKLDGFFDKLDAMYLTV